MKALLNMKVHIAWLIVALVAAGAMGLVGMLMINAPPSNNVLISAPSPEAGDKAGEQAGQAAPRPATPSDVAGTPTVSANAEGFSQVVNATGGTPDGASPAARDPQPATSSPAPTDTPSPIAVYVSGAVNKPGVYVLPAGARAADALAAAGGPTSEADLDQVNLAARVTDEEHLLVPRKGEVAAQVAATPKSSGTAQKAVTAGSSPAPRQSPSKTALSGKVDVNRASAQELEALPGIGPSLAERIVAYRLQNGPFATIEDLMSVPGIKEGIFSRIRDYIMVGSR